MRLKLQGFVILAVMGYTLNGAQAQVDHRSQEYINGTMEQKLHDLDERVKVMEDLVRTALYGLVGTLALSGWQVLLQYQARKNKD